MRERLTTEILLKRIENNFPDMFLLYDYSLTKYEKLSKKIKVICPTHGLFEVWPGDHMRGMSGCKECIKLKRINTMLTKYGVDNIFKKTDFIQESMLKKHGVKNPGLLSDHISKIKKTNLKKYGVEWAIQNKEVKNSITNTCLQKYGVPYPIMNKNISGKMVKTKIINGTFDKSNSSLEATNFIKNYINEKGYEIDQCAYADHQLNLHEWGIYHEGRWVLYDLVVFEKGHRGNKNKIIEILEYHGPFHYTEKEVSLYGDKKAFPWKSNHTTILESYKKDEFKKILGKILTNNYTIIRTRKEGDL